MSGSQSPLEPGESLWLRCYKIALAESKWWESDRRIKELAMIIWMEHIHGTVRETISLLKDLTSYLNEQKRKANAEGPAKPDDQEPKKEV